MKRIKKDKEPIWFIEWKEEFEKNNSRKANYKDDFPQEKKRKLREHLLKEQGYICCYCMRRIQINNSHLEHFWPKDAFPEKDMDYENMLASCEGETIGEDHCGHRKNNYYDKNMIIPTNAMIEQMFHYIINGDILPDGKNQIRKAAKDMIREFGLNSFHLKRNRRLAIEESEVFDDCEYSKEEISDIINYYNSMENGKYQEYCKAIIDGLVWRLKREI